MIPGLRWATRTTVRTSEPDRPSRRIIRRGAKSAAIALLAALFVILVYFSIQTWASRMQFAQRWADNTNATDSRCSLDGQWVGQWKSKGVGDGGELKAIIWNEPGGSWHAQFFADHYAIFQKNQELTFIPTRNPDGQWTFEGIAKLAEGEHRYSATCDGKRIELTWSSALDHGVATFEREAASAKPTQLARSSQKMRQ